MQIVLFEQRKAVIELNATNSMIAIALFDFIFNYGNLFQCKMYKDI